MLLSSFVFCFCNVFSMFLFCFCLCHVLRLRSFNWQLHSALSVVGYHDRGLDTAHSRSKKQNFIKYIY